LIIMNIDYDFKTYIGVKDREFGDFFSHKDNLFLVVEGVGAEYLSEIAREGAMEIVPEAFFRHLSKGYLPGDALVKALEEANEGILAERRKLGEKMAASISAVYIKDRIMYFSHLGDTRIYSYQGGELNQLTRDHTIIEKDPFVDKRSNSVGQIPVLTQALGIHEKPSIEVKKYPLERRGLVFLTTEGLTDRISNREIQWLSHKTQSPSRLCEGLMDLVKRKGGSANNMTVGIIKYGGISKGFRNILMTYSAFFLLIIFVMAGYLMKYSDEKIPQEDLIDSPVVTQPVIKKEEDQQVRDTRNAPVQAPQAVRKAIERVSENVTAPETVVNKGKERGGDEDQGEELFNMIYAFLIEWKTSWEKTAGKNGDLEKYISFYSGDFLVNRLDREKWKQDKFQKGRKKDWIEVEISDIKISGPSDDNKVEVRFDQDYRSSNYSVKSKKMLLLKKETTGWKIVNERST